MFGRLIGGIKSGALGLFGFVRRVSQAVGGRLPSASTPWIAKVIFYIKLASIKVGFWVMAGWWYVTRPEGVGAKCLVFHKGKILLVRHTYGPDVWTIPGGRIKRNETPEEAAAREVCEETGFSMGQLYSLGDAWDEHYRKEERVHYFFGETEGEVPLIDPLEIREARWFGPLTLPFPVSARVIKALDLYDKFEAGTTIVLADAIIGGRK
jgi:ADP-ribose pyrophosphatase YjhB (NUDIX family)